MLGLITASHAQLLSGMKEKQNGQDFLNLICIYKNLSMKIAVAHDSLLGLLLAIQKACQGMLFLLCQRDRE